MSNHSANVITELKRFMAKQNAIKDSTMEVLEQAREEMQEHLHIEARANNRTMSSFRSTLANAKIVERIGNIFGVVMTILIISGTAIAVFKFGGSTEAFYFMVSSGSFLLLITTKMGQIFHEPLKKAYYGTKKQLGKCWRFICRKGPAPEPSSDYDSPFIEDNLAKNQLIITLPDELHNITTESLDELKLNIDEVILATKNLTAYGPSPTEVSKIAGSTQQKKSKPAKTSRPTQFLPEDNMPTDRKHGTELSTIRMDSLSNTPQPALLTPPNHPSNAAANSPDVSSQRTRRTTAPNVSISIAAVTLSETPYEVEENADSDAIANDDWNDGNNSLSPNVQSKARSTAMATQSQIQPPNSGNQFQQHPIQAGQRRQSMISNGLNSPNGAGFTPAYTANATQSTRQTTHPAARNNNPSAPGTAAIITTGTTAPAHVPAAAGERRGSAQILANGNPMQAGGRNTPALNPSVSAAQPSASEIQPTSQKGKARDDKKNNGKMNGQPKNNKKGKRK